MGKCLGRPIHAVPRRSSATSWGPWPLLEHLVVSKSLENWQNVQIFTFRTKLLGPLVAKWKNDKVNLSGLAQRSFLPSFVQIRPRSRQLSKVGSHSNATRKHSTRAQKMECYGSNPFVLKMDWSWATTFQLLMALYMAQKLAFRKWEAEKESSWIPIQECAFVLIGLE